MDDPHCSLIDRSQLLVHSMVSYSDPNPFYSPAQVPPHVFVVQASSHPSGLGTGDQAEKARLLRLEQAFEQARALLAAERLDELRELLEVRAE